MKHIVILLLVFSSTVATAADQFRFNTNCRNAYDLILSLRLEEGREVLAREKAADRHNLIPYFVENYADFLTVFIQEKQTDYYQYLNRKKDRARKIESGDKNSPYYLYTQAEMNLQSAILRLKFEEYIGAVSEARRAFAQLQENREKFPGFKANLKSLAAFHAALGAVPEKYQWAVNLLGMEGNLEQGMAEFEELLEHMEEEDFIFEQETRTIYTFTLLYLQKDKENAWESVKELSLEDNLLNHFAFASVAMYLGKNDEAMARLEQRPSGSEYLDFYFMEYMLGLSKLRKLDYSAKAHFEKYVGSYEGINYIKESHQKLAWIALLNGSKKEYKKQMELCKDEGGVVVDADKAALAEANEGQVPNVRLLKARLLFDGGYYRKAVEYLNGLTTADFDTEADKIEFTYRAGRILHEWGKEDQAIGYYYATIKNGSHTRYYYPANAALQLGIIYEGKEDYDKAHYFFQKVLESNKHVFKNSLDAQAKAGLNRIKDKA